MTGYDAILAHKTRWPLEEVIEGTRTAVQQQGLSRDALDALARHGYEPRAAASGVSGKPDVWEGHKVILRTHVCELDGITIDGHSGSDLDPGADYCIYCGKEGWVAEEMAREDAG